MIFKHKKLAQKTVTPSGEIYEPTFKMVIDDYGHKEIVPDGEKNVLLPVQECLEETKIENIVKRAMTGDESALNAKIGRFMDVTNAPKTLAEAQKLIIEANQAFEKLPVEEKEKYGFEPERFIDSISKEIVRKANEPKHEEVNENEQEQ